MHILSINCKHCRTITLPLLLLLATSGCLYLTQAVTAAPNNSAECPPGQYGTGPNSCRPCTCSRDGSSSQICSSIDGRCSCLTGVGGDRCDQCARGYVGRVPSCQWCGECFDQWDQAVQALRNDTQALLDKVRRLLEIGTPGAYGKEFAEIEAKLERIAEILAAQRLNADQLAELARQIQLLTAQLREIERQLDKNERDAEQTSRRTAAVLAALRDIERVIDELVIVTDQLRENATQLQEANVDGAYNSIIASQNRSRDADKAVRQLRPLLLESEQKRRVTENLLASAVTRYNSSVAQNEAILQAMANQIGELEKGVVPINGHVCASNATVGMCDPLCGGSLCAKCGGLSCSDGATTRANNALEMAKQADDLIKAKYAAALAQNHELGEAHNISDVALEKARLAMAMCDESRAKFASIAAELTSFIDAVDRFTGIDGARPAEVRVLGLECLALRVGLKPEQILDLARQINETIASLTDIDRILHETANDLATAQELKAQADHAKDQADNILEMARQVLEMLKQAALEQARAAAAIAAASGDIDSARADLVEIGQELERWEKFIRELEEAVRGLRERLDEILKKFAQNELFVAQASGAANDAGKLTDNAAQLTDEVAAKVALLEEKMRQKARDAGEAKDRAERLKNDAMSLAGDTQAKLGQLHELDDLFDEQARQLKDWQDLVDDLHRQMDQYVKDIDAKAQYYRQCQL